MTAWISLPAEWRIQDVQAVLTVIIAFICAGGVFVLVRCFWINASCDVVLKGRKIPTHNLLSINNVGEVTDILWLLRSDLFSTKYTKLLVQSVFVVLLTTASLLSGLIARYSTRAEMLSIPRNVSGILAERTLQSAVAGISVNETFTALKSARFPPNQLLDFLPDSNSNWDFQSDQWTNNSWSMNCTFTDLQEIPDTSVQDCSGNIFTEAPYLLSVLNDWPSTAWSSGWSGSGHEYNLTWWKDYVIFLHASWGLRYEDNSIFSPGQCGCPADEMYVRSFWFHFQEAPRSNSTDASCLFSRGSVGTLSFTGTSCKLSRVAPSIPEDEFFDYAGAAPDVVDDQGVAGRYNLQFGTKSIRESMQNVPLTVITGEELALFYQAQLIAKDTELSSQRTAFRTVNAFTPVAQISTVCTVFCCIGALLVLFGLSYYLSFLFRFRTILSNAPQSKLDWVLLLLKGHMTDEDKKQLLSTSFVQESGDGLLKTTTRTANNDPGAILLAENDQIAEVSQPVNEPAVPTLILIRPSHAR